MKKFLMTQSGKNRIYGVISFPENRKDSPCLILGHGFTGNKDERMLVTISERLLEAGISSVRFDYAGHGESGGASEEVTISQEINDLKSVIQYVKQDKEVRTDKIILGGHSLGGLIALLTAYELPQEIGGIVLISPALTMFHELIKDLTDDSLCQVMNGKPFDLGGFLIGKKMIDECSTIDAFSLARSMHPKALLIHGESDRDTPPYISAVLKQIWKDNAKLCMIPHADHCFRTAEAIQRVADEITAYMLELFQ